LDDGGGFAWFLVLSLSAVAGVGVGLIVWQIVERLDAWRFSVGD
jgi:hypothetical protein